MSIEFSQEHEELRQSVRRFLDDKSSEQQVRALMESDEGYDRETWSQMATQLGLQGLIIPEEFGGAGMSQVELTIVMEEMGKSLFCGPYFSTVMAINALHLLGDESSQKELLPGIASGETLATLAFSEEGDGWDVTSVKTEAKESQGVWTLHGEKAYVIDGHIADVLLVIARTEQGLSLFRVAGDSGGLERKLLPTLDLTRKLASVSLSAVPALRISGGEDRSKELEELQSLAIASLAAEQAGGAQQCLEMSTDYAKTRMQFGRAIGSFQAIKHRCADMLVAVEFAKSAAYHAGFAAGGDRDEALLSTSMAKAYCSDAYFDAAADTIQIHGGMGFTWEHPAHLYFKRAKSSSILFGDASHHRERLSHRLSI